LKLSKFKIAVLVLLTVVVAVAVLPLMKVAYDEFYFKPWYESLTPIKKEYVHPTPFFATWYGFGTIAVWGCLGFVWLTYSIVKLKQSRSISNILAVTTFPLFFCCLSAMLNNQFSHRFNSRYPMVYKGVK
jgi:uncharacterized metal-binding protein